MRTAYLTLATILTLCLLAISAEAAPRALLIGISDYQHLPYFSTKERRWYKDLNGPRNDVPMVRKALISRYHFPPEAIRVLTDREATREAILGTVESWLIQGSQPGDLVVFYFSGHGFPWPDQNGDETDDGMDEVLAPYDVILEGTKELVEARLIRDDLLGGLLRRLEGRQVVVILDACFSGTATRSLGGVPVATLEETGATRERRLAITLQEPPTETKSFPRSLQLPRQPDIPVGQIVLTASEEHQLSVEREFADGWNGALTRALVEGMTQSRDHTYRDLYEHAKEVIKDRYKLDQDPQIEPSSGRILDQLAFTPEVALPIQKLDAPRPKPRPPVPSSPEIPAPAPVVIAELPPAPPPLPALQPPADIKGERVLLKIDPLRGGDPALRQRLQTALARLPYVELVQEGFFDRLIRGEVKDGRYYLRLLNGIGDVILIPPTSRLETLIKAIAPHLEYAYIVKQLAHLHHPDPPFRVDLSVVGDRRDFCIDRHEKIVYQLTCEEDCYPLLLNLDPKGNIHLLFPNKYHPKQRRLRAGETLEIPNEQMRRGGFEFLVLPPAGEETIKVIATTTPLDLRQLGLANFEKTFQTISGQAMQASSPSRSLVLDLLPTIENQQRQQGGLRWSEDTVVVRSHERCRR